MKRPYVVRCQHVAHYACSTNKFLDFTAATILDKFQNETAAQSVERVLKKLSSEKATEILAVSGVNGYHWQFD
jgi:hypothetical protein